MIDNSNLPPGVSASDPHLTLDEDEAIKRIIRETLTSGYPARGLAHNVVADLDAEGYVIVRAVEVDQSQLDEFGIGPKATQWLLGLGLPIEVTP